MQKHCISVEDVYGTAAPEVPQGYELTGEFRPYKAGETVLLTNGEGAHKTFADGDALYPRLILRATPTIRDIYGKELSELTPPKGYEFGEFRRVQTGEDWLGAYGKLMINHPEVDPQCGRYRLILKKLPTIEDIYGAPLEKLNPPIGYRFTGEFRKPTEEDVCLLPGSPFETGHTVQYKWIRPKDMEQLKPRLILEKLPPTPTIKDVYGTDNPAIPKGWKMKEFRRIADGEKVDWLADYGKGVVCRGTTGSPFSHEGRSAETSKWRIILEKDVDLREFKWTTGPEFIYGDEMPTVPAGYKVVAFRPPREDELFLSTLGTVEVALSNYNNSPRLIPRLILSPLGPR